MGNSLALARRIPTSWKNANPLSILLGNDGLIMLLKEEDYERIETSPFMFYAILILLSKNRFVAS